MSKRTICIFFVGVISGATTFITAQSEWKHLFNGKDLSGWEVFVGPEEEDGEPLGLNNDPLGLFTVTELDGENVLRISGEINASIATRKEFENYHLTLEFRWGQKVFTRRNSGLLYHSYGDFGVGLGVWMSSHELQLLTGHIGDSYRMGNTCCEIPVIVNPEGGFIYNSTGEKTESFPGSKSVIVAKDKDYENPVGEWNRVELYCYGRTAVHVVNGKVNMINYNSGKYLENGTVEPLTRGRIQIQSEGGELFVRSVKIRPIDQIPPELFK